MSLTLAEELETGCFKVPQNKTTPDSMTLLEEIPASVSKSVEQQNLCDLQKIKPQWYLDVKVTYIAFKLWRN